MKFQWLEYSRSVSISLDVYREFMRLKLMSEQTWLLGKPVGGVSYDE